MDDRHDDAELAITDPSGGTRATIAPWRGGMVTGLEVEGRALLYLDRETLLDRSKNVRGGSPVLFPTPGKLAGDAWARDGHRGRSPQHGFARRVPWKVERAEAHTALLSLAPSADELASYPWEHRVELRHSVAPGVLRTDARIENRSREPMPFGFGLHPYFALSDPRTFELSSGAMHAFDNVGQRETPFDARSLTLGASEIDLHLLDHGSSAIAFACDGVRMRLEASRDFTHWVVWSVPGKPFVCVEPWTCPGDAMNHGDRLLTLAPGESRVLRVELRVASA